MQKRWSILAKFDMEFSGSKNFIQQSSSSARLSIEEEFIIEKTLLTHNPDVCRVDCKLFFQAMENVMLFAISPSADVADLNTDLNTSDAILVPDIENIGSNETLGNIIYKISRAILWECYDNADMDKKTLLLLEMLGLYRWDAKVVMVLAALAISYGEFRLILQLCAHNSMAASIAILKNLSWKNMESMTPRFKALEMLIKEMVEIANCIIRFEGLPLQLDGTSMAVIRSQIYLSTYWIFRSSLACASQITDLIALKQENTNTTTNAAWGLSSLALKLSSLSTGLRSQVDACEKRIEQLLDKKLMNHLNDHTQVDNQEVLHLLFSLTDDSPLKDCSSSQAKVRISRLEKKVVIFLISKPELLPIDRILSLVRQTHDHPDNKKIQQKYEILWVPISSSGTWTLDEHRSFDYLSNTLPWLSIRQPWLLNSAVINIIREEWKFREEPMMVVLDSQGFVTNNDATDMMLIWGAKAFPFSTTREKELWETENWSLQLMVDGIDPFLMKTMVEESKNICICGSSSVDWIREFNSRIKEIKDSGLQLQVIYIGSRNPSENMQNALAILNKDSSFTSTKIQFFWLRLETMKNSILRLGQTFSNCEFVLANISELLDMDDQKDDNNWAVFGCGKSKDMVMLLGNKIMECLNKFTFWGENVAKLGFVDAIRKADNEFPSFSSDNELPCGHSKTAPYDEGMIRESVVCDKCKRLMKQFIVYECKEPN